MAPVAILERARVGSPIGELTLFARSGRLVSVAFEGRADEALGHLLRHPVPWGSTPEAEVRVEESPDPAGAATALARYFAGELEAIRGVEVDPAGTAFQKRVWAALRRIRPGTTLSYADLALKIGQPTACRAVAQANAKNPVPIFIPCHRVIAARGDLHGYGGGLERKRRLLELEGALADEGLDLFGTGS